MPSLAKRLLPSLSRLPVSKLFRNSNLIKPSSKISYPAPFSMLEPGRKKPLDINVFFANLRLWSMTNLNFRDPFVTSLTHLKIISKCDLRNHEFLVAEVYPSISHLQDGRPPIHVVLEQSNYDDRIGITVDSLQAQAKYQSALALDYINFPIPGDGSVSSPLLFYQLILALQRIHPDTKPYAFEGHDCSFICHSAMKVIAALAESPVTALKSPAYCCRSEVVTRTSRCSRTGTTSSLSHGCLYDIINRTLEDIRSFEDYIDHYHREIQRMLAPSKFGSHSNGEHEVPRVESKMTEESTVTFARDAADRPVASEDSLEDEIVEVRRKEGEELAATGKFVTMSSTTLSSESWPLEEQVASQVFDKHSIAKVINTT